MVCDRALAAPAVALVSEPEPDPASDASLSALVGGGIYTLLLGGALLWLWARDRLEILHSRAIGEHGLLAAAGLGRSSGRWARRRRGLILA